MTVNDFGTITRECQRKMKILLCLCTVCAMHVTQMKQSDKHDKKTVKSNCFQFNSWHDENIFFCVVVNLLFVMCMSVFPINMIKYKNDREIMRDELANSDAQTDYTVKINHQHQMRNATNTHSRRVVI